MLILCDVNIVSCTDIPPDVLQGIWSTFEYMHP